MIDIIQQLQARNPALGSRVIVLRADNRALSGPETLTPEAAAWIAEKTPGARLSRESVLLAPYPGAQPSERDVTVVAFQEAHHLAAFASHWTGEPPEDETGS